jgi:succinate dehydrogenase / fumarate reductase cytochrome b subunit
MKVLVATWDTSVGHKALVAISGLVSLGWCLLHALGNLTAWSGAEAMDGYAAWLRGARGLPLLGMRLCLLSIVGLHVLFALGAWRRARDARPVGYAVVRHEASTVASRSVRIGGLGLGAFIVYHVLHFNLGVLHPHFVPGQVYGNLVSAFVSPVVVLIYLFGAFLCAFHVAHGLSAALSSLGWLAPSRGTRWLSLGLATLLGGALSATPLAVAFGALR